jgi:hypothetical protein
LTNRRIEDGRRKFLISVAGGIARHTPAGRCRVPTRQAGGSAYMLPGQRPHRSHPLPTLPSALFASRTDRRVRLAVQNIPLEASIRVPQSEIEEGGFTLDGRADKTTCVLMRPVTQPTASSRAPQAKGSKSASKSREIVSH